MEKTANPQHKNNTGNLHSIGLCLHQAFAVYTETKTLHQQTPAMILK